ncbi:head GIN domain-containing protein [Ferruginibacter sp. SUN106]|uniref:head GIN domain-containing protein n=1 Tax=Ferruginibacter sp. SUN106 TaxID=2978348 RepID=UPI003D36524B
MKKIVLSLLVSFSFFAANAQKEIVNDPNAEIRTISGSFNSIKISGGIDLFLTQSDEEAVVISASEDKFKEGIKTVVEDKVLKIYYFGDKSWNSMKNKNLRVYVSFKNLEKINASSACDVQVAGVITVPSLTISLSGACDFKGAVKITDLKMDLSGASDVTIKGIASMVRIESSGASDVKGYDLITDVCTAKASGASDVNITVNKELSANASGASDISYKGEAKVVESHASGASSVSKKG